MSAAPLSLDDKYTRESGRVFLTGTQALVRLAMIQRSRDLAAGLNTGGLHLRLPRLAARRLRPGALEGEEAPRVAPRLLHAGRERGARRDRGVGHAAGGPLPRAPSTTASSRCGTARGPGVDRCGDVFKHANAAGHREARRRAPRRGRRPRLQVLDAAAPVRARLRRGDDPGAVPHGRAGDHRPGPARLRDVALLRAATSPSRRSPRRSTPRPRSRRSGESADRAARRTSRCPRAGLNIRWPDTPLEQELRLQHDKIYAALAYCRANGLNRITIDSPAPAARHHRLGQVATSTCCRRSRTSASTSATPRRSASASSRSACPGRWSPTACASSPRASTRSSWSRRSASSSSTR